MRSFAGALVAALVFALAPAALAAPQAPVALGVHLPYVSDSGAEIDAYASEVGARPKIVMLNQGWDEPLLYPGQMRAITSRGATPLITWDPIDSAGGIPLRAIAAGAHDDYLRRSADMARAWGGTLYVRFAHEMNLPEAPDGPGRNGNTPAQFIAAWRHVVGIFRNAGADNVRWVWSPNVQCFGRCPFTAFFPGDEWVDWVALDGYNYAAASHVPWFSFTTLFAGSYDIITRLSAKPVMVAETASAEDGGDKAAWIRSAFLRALPTRFPRIRAVVWFDQAKETDWRVDSSTASLNAWRDVVSSPLYNDAAARRLAAGRVGSGYFQCRLFGGSRNVCSAPGGYRSLATESDPLAR